MSVVLERVHKKLKRLLSEGWTNIDKKLIRMGYSPIGVERASIFFGPESFDPDRIKWVKNNELSKELGQNIEVSRDGKYLRIKRIGPSEDTIFRQE